MYNQTIWTDHCLMFLFLNWFIHIVTISTYICTVLYNVVNEPTKINKWMNFIVLQFYYKHSNFMFIPHTKKPTQWRWGPFNGYRRKTPMTFPGKDRSVDEKKNKIKYENIYTYKYLHIQLFLFILLFLKCLKFSKKYYIYLIYKKER